MKFGRGNIFFLLLLVCCFSCFAGTQNRFEDYPLVVGVLMVKNESPVIVETLQPLVDGGIDAYLIFDTGSTDDTVEKTRAFFEKHQITHAYVIQESFIDFAVSRNRAIELAEEKFPKATFILMLDAEWYMQNVPDLIRFCWEVKDQNLASYNMRIVVNGSLEFCVPRLMRCGRNNRFFGAVHEYVVSESMGTVPSHIMIACNQTRYGIEKSCKRFERDRGLLLKEYANNPNDARSAFYLAQTYECLGDLENAYHFYDICMRLDGWDEERFMACLRLAGVVEALAKRDIKKETHYDWSLALWYYLKAFSMRNYRIEPLVAIARHYLASDNHALAHVFALRALDLPYPKNEALFVDKRMYDYERYDIVGRCAWYIGKYEAGERALRKGLEVSPFDSHFSENLSFYLERKYATGLWKIRAVNLSNEPRSKDIIKNHQKKEWSILICTMAERKKEFEKITKKLKKQIIKNNLQGTVEILYFLDERGDFPTGFKRNKLLQESKGQYICFVDDDDDLHDDYIKMIYDSLDSKPDCVSLTGIITIGGQNPKKFIHSVKFDHYFETEESFFRPPNHLNVIKREVAIQFPFMPITRCEDTLWAQAVANSGKLKTEVEITEPYYFYLNG